VSNYHHLEMWEHWWWERRRQNSKSRSRGCSPNWHHSLDQQQHIVCNITINIQTNRLCALTKGICSLYFW